MIITLKESIENAKVELDKALQDMKARGPSGASVSPYFKGLYIFARRNSSSDPRILAFYRLMGHTVVNKDKVSPIDPDEWAEYFSDLADASYPLIDQILLDEMPLLIDEFPKAFPPEFVVNRRRLCYAIDTETQEPFLMINPQPYIERLERQGVSYPKP